MLDNQDIFFNHLFLYLSLASIIRLSNTSSEYRRMLFTYFRKITKVPSLDNFRHLLGFYTNYPKPYINSPCPKNIFNFLITNIHHPFTRLTWIKDKLDYQLERYNILKNLNSEDLELRNERISY